MAFGVNWVFEKSRMGDYQVGYCEPPADWPLARAVAASSCFPPVFNPLPMSLSPEEMKGGAATESERRACLEDLRLTDGGNYDNLGLEPVWKDHATVLVSNGGATFDFGADKNLIWRLSRYQAIQGRQAEAIRVRWLISSFIAGELQGTYWGIGTSTGTYGRQAPEGYAEDIVDLISEIRTDLDAFSSGERYVLENHGYLLADSAARRYVPSLITIDASLRAPHQRWMDEPRVREALKLSHRRKLPLGRY
jgi:NTE family protein